MFYLRYKTWLIACFLAVCTALGATPPNWSVIPAQFQYSMSLNAQVQIQGVGIQSGANLLGAFVNGQCRGVGTPTMVGGQAFYFFTLYSNFSSGETLSFQFYHAVDDLVYDAAQTIPFVRSQVIGSVIEPFIFSFVPGDDYPISSWTLIIRVGRICTPRSRLAFWKTPVS